MDVKDHEVYMQHQQMVQLYAEALSDIEAVRIAQDNRVRSLLAETGMEEPPAAYQAIRAHLADAEKGLTRELQKAMKQHPLGEFVVATPGIGEKQAGRLLASIGDPCWNAAEERPRRGPAEFWKYMGLAPGQRKRRGERRFGIKIGGAS